MSQALYRKWRPRQWDEVLGQEHVVQTLKNAVHAGKIGHAYLFSGPRGTGKTTTARLLAKAVNCLAEDPAARPCNQCAHCKAVNEGRFLDLIEIDAASNTSVDDIRDLRDKINFSPSQGQYKVYIIDEVHMLSTAAFNAILKTLEEPPAHAIFILATTEVHKIPATVLSRCQRHEFRRIPVAEIIKELRMLAVQEKIDVNDDALTLIARQATGAMRDAISLLDQLSSNGQKIDLALAQTVLGTAASQTVVDLVEAIQQRQLGLGMDCIHRALDNGTDPRQFARQVVDYLRNLMLIRLDNKDQVDVTKELLDQMIQQAKAFELPRLLNTLRIFNTAASEVRSGWQPGLLLELAVAETMEEPAAPPAPVHASHAVEKAALAAKPAPQTVAPVSKPAPATAPVEAPKAAPTKSAAPAPTTGAISQTEIQQNWTKIRAEVKKINAKTEGLLNSCRAITVKDGNLVLGFASDLLKSKMETSENLEVTQKAVAQVVGVNIPIVCVVASGKLSIAATDEDVDGDGIVGAALNLGGKIVQKD